MCAARGCSLRSPHMVAETRLTHVCLAQKRAALTAHDGGDERGGIDTCVCRPQVRAALSAHGGEDEADTCVRRLQRSPHMVGETMRWLRKGWWDFVATGIYRNQER